MWSSIMRHNNNLTLTKFYFLRGIKKSNIWWCHIYPLLLPVYSTFNNNTSQAPANAVFTVWTVNLTKSSLDCMYSRHTDVVILSAIIFAPWGQDKKKDTVNQHPLHIICVPRLIYILYQGNSLFCQRAWSVCFQTGQRGKLHVFWYKYLHFIETSRSNIQSY